jgi:5,10-methylenetetrahydromethanopterin reductase
MRGLRSRAMRVGFNVTHRDAAATRRAATLAEAADIDILTLGDSQSTVRDVYAQLTICALATERVHLGPFVTNPVTRHPTVTASAIATIDELSNGRAYLGIGRGNASVLNAGLPRATPADIRSALQVIDHVLGRPRADLGAIAPLSWTKRRIPVLVHSSGPRTLAVAVEAADGVIIRWGDTDPLLLDEHLARIRQLRARSPRAAEPFQVWAVVSVCVARSVETARETMDVAHRARSLPPREWPAELADRFREFHARYRFEHHASRTNKANKRLLAEVGLTEFTLDRYAVIGEARDIARRLADGARGGIDAFILAVEDPRVGRADEERIADASEIRRALVAA